jgi:hypothetical protein
VRNKRADGAPANSDGAPRTTFAHGAIEPMNLLGSETSAQEMGVVDLGEALDLVVLVAEVDPEKLDGYAGVPRTAR